MVPSAGSLPRMFVLSGCSSVMSPYGTLRFLFFSLDGPAVRITPCGGPLLVAACLFYGNLFKELFLCSQAPRLKAVAKIGVLFLTAKSFQGKIEKISHYFAFLDKTQGWGNGASMTLRTRRKQYISNLNLLIRSRTLLNIKNKNILP